MRARGAVANESMSQGCVLVGSDAIGSIPFLVKHRQNGLVFRSCQVDSLVEEAEWLITHPQEMRRMQRAAVQHDARDMVAKKRRPSVPATGGGFGKRKGMLRDGGAGE